MFLSKRKKAHIVIVITALVSFFPGAYISHAATTTTSLTFVINPFTGGLSINVPLAGNLGSMESPGNIETATAQLDTVTVTDTRRTLTLTRSWLVSAISTDLLSGSDSLTASSIGYSSGIPTLLSGLAGLTEITRASLLTTGAVQSGATSTGNHVASWRPTLIIVVPQYKNAGTYVGTMTHSVV